jgi:hypothetical protein
MSEVDSRELKKAVESQHGGRASFVQSVPVREEFKGELVWDGTVSVFDLADSPSGATRAYAWSYERDGGKRRFFAVLHMGPITGPREAVRAAIVAEQRRANGCPTCGGLGYITETHSPKPLAKKPPPKECPDCKGTGSRSRIMK